MFESLALDGVGLLAALAAAVLLGAFAKDYVVDRLTGVPSPLRAALSATEASAIQALKDAQAKVVSEVSGALAKPPAVIAAQLKPAPAPAPAPAKVTVEVPAAAPAVVVAAAPAAPAAPAA